MKVAKPTSAHFRERARHYRLAEAIADAPRDVEMFHDLATLFERLSEDFARMVHGRSGASAVDGVRGPADGRRDGARVEAEGFGVGLQFGMRSTMSNQSPVMKNLLGFASINSRSSLHGSTYREAARPGVS